MVSQHDATLGFGVRVMRASDSTLVVLSPLLDLGWRPPHGKVPGTAVMWQKTAYEVVSKQAVASGHRWSLRQWPTDATMRTVCPLDADMVSAAHAEADARARAARLRRVLAPVLPLVGLAPGPLQERWRAEWGFPAGVATTLSALAELAVGGVGVIQLLALFVGQAWFLPPPLRFLALAGPFLWLESSLRLHRAATQGEAMGSVLGLPLLLMAPSAPTRHPAPPGPRLHALEDDERTLELFTPIVRRDWTEGGLLPYRGQRFRCLSMAQTAHGWLYRFTKDTGHTNGAGEPPTLRLLPPQQRLEERKRPPSDLKAIVGTAAQSTLMCLAPRVYQERWTARLGLPATVLTYAGAGIELLGGMVNLSGDLPSSSPFVILDVFFIGEGLIRLAVAAITRRPVGSVFGWPLKPLFERWTREDGLNVER